MNKSKKGIKRMGSAYSSYHGRVHNPNITTKPKIYIGGGVPLSSVCAGHMVIGEPELSVAKAKAQLKHALDEKQ